MWKPAAVRDKFLGVLEVMIMKLDYIFSPFAFVLGFCEVEYFLNISSDVTDELTPLHFNKKHRKWINSFWLKI